MGQRVIAENAGVVSVTYKLPNKHYIPVNMNYIGVDNTTPLSNIQFCHCVLLLSVTPKRIFLSPEVVDGGDSDRHCDRENQSFNLVGYLLIESTMIEGASVAVHRDSRDS
jgi:hypothetical protein